MSYSRRVVSKSFAIPISFNHMNESIRPPDKKTLPASSSEMKHTGGAEEFERKAWTTRSSSLFTNVRFLGFVGFFVFVLIPLAVHQGVVSFVFSLITFAEVVLLFNILIIVHELGHFLAAKWCGLKIDKFAIWFGKPLWMKKIDGVEYIVGTVPAGGYVALPQMAPMEAIEGKTDTPREDLPPASPWQKIIVAFAGPLFSFGLALVFGTIVWVVGKPSTYSEKTTTIGYAAPDGPAAKAGLQAGDVITSINGHKVSRWMGAGNGVTWNIITSTVTPLTIDVLRDGQPRTFQITPEVDPTVSQHWWDRTATPKIQIAPDEKTFIVSKIIADGPAAAAGLLKDDRLLTLDGVRLRSFLALERHLKDGPNAPMIFTVQRGDETKTITVVPVKPLEPHDIPKDQPQTNPGFELDDKADVVMDHPTPWNQVHESIDLVRGTLAALFTHNSKVNATQLSGPIGIMNVLFEVLGSENGWRLALWLGVVINVNLAILNMFPLPVLDGGHIALSLIEWVRRRPLSMAILEPLQTACALALIGYMAFITFYDVQDSGKIAFAPGGEVKFAPKSSTSP
jgi:regulator of sigma E protease